MRTITADALVELLDEPEEYFLMDVREPDEFSEWRIPGAVNVPLGELAARVGEVPRGREVVTVCAVGSRASTAAEMLARSGIDAEVLQGGMSAWATVYDEVEVVLGGATVVQVRRRGKGCLSYLIGAGQSAVVIDPSADVAQYTDRATSRGWEVTYVVDTHLHADHVSGARALADATGATLMLNPADAFEFDFSPLADGMRIHIGEGADLDVSIVSTPGHTMGSTCFVLGEYALFSGDTLFLESVGRPDLADRAEQFAHDLYASLHERVLVHPDALLVFPAHFGESVEVRGGEPTAATLGALRSSLRQLEMGEDDFVAWACSSVKQRPPNYVAIVGANQGATSIGDEERRGLEAGPNRCAVAG